MFGDFGGKLRGVEMDKPQPQPELFNLFVKYQGSTVLKRIGSAANSSKQMQMIQTMQTMQTV